MFLTTSPLDRRTFLRGMGATVALPLLDAMIPARALLASSSTRPVSRMAFVYFPHGAIMNEWAPAADGNQLQLGRILAPLTPYRHRLTVVSGLENRHAYGPVHAITPGTWLSGTSCARKQDEVAHSATVDQLAADHLGDDTRIPSLAVAAEQPKTIGAGIWTGEYDESRSTTISFRHGQQPVPMEWHPRAVFDSLFADQLPAGATHARGQRSPSVLDRIAGEAASLRKRLGPDDRTVLGDYFDTVRDVERRVDIAGAGEGSAATQADAADRFKDRLALMFDMIALAFRADITRVASVMMAAESSSLTYDHVGVHESFHLLSHHQNDPEKIEKLVRIQAFHTRMFAEFVRTLAGLPDGDGTLLDRSLILFGSNMSDSHAHDHFPLPLAVIGGAAGTIRGGRRLQYPDRTPIANLHLTMLRRTGIDAESFGDGTCECSEL